jgi:hypothetical protein
LPLSTASIFDFEICPILCNFGFVFCFKTLLSHDSVNVVRDLILQRCEVTHVINMILTKHSCIENIGVGNLRTSTFWTCTSSVYALKVTKNKNANS